MKLKVQASLAGAMIFSAMVMSVPASVAANEVNANSETKCVVQKDGYTWNICTDKMRRQPIGGAPGAAPAGAPPAEEREKAKVELFGLSFDVETNKPEEDDLGYGIQQGGGDNGR